MDKDFKKQIIADFGLIKMNVLEQEKIIERIGNMLFEAVVERSIDEMDEQAMSNFENLMSSVGSDYQKVIGFLKEHVPSFNTIVSEEMSRLKKATSGIFA